MHELTDLIETLEALTAGGEPAVLATVVNTSGSTYRRPGARLLLTPDGRSRGMVSGGCLENAVIEQAHGVLSTGEPIVMTYDGTAPEDIVWGFGLGCNGRVQVLIERIEPGRTPYLEFIADCLRRRRRGVLATVFADQGRHPLALGTRLWLDGAGTLGPALADPAAVQALAEAARAALTAGRSRVISHRRADAQSEVLLELIEPPPALAIFGAGADALPLARMAKTLGWEVTVTDHRPGYACRERFPMADRIVAAEPEQAVPGRVPLDERTAAVVMTHHYLRDRALLRLLLESAVCYLGMLGPKSRTERLLQELQAEGPAPAQARMQRLYAPVGLDIGAETPHEVALAIVAEIQAVLAERSGGSLRHRQGPIHPPLDPAENPIKAQPL